MGGIRGYERCLVATVGAQGLPGGIIGYIRGLVTARCSRSEYYRVTIYGPARVTAGLPFWYFPLRRQLVSRYSMSDK